MATMDKTTLYLPADLHAMLKQAAKRTGQPEAEIIREALRDFLRREGRPHLKSLGVAKSKAITGRGAEDWLQEHWQPR